MGRGIKGWGKVTRSGLLGTPDLVLSRLNATSRRRLYQPRGAKSFWTALFAYFGTEVTVDRATEVAKALVAWRDEAPGDADTTVVVRDTGFVNSAAKLNFAAALDQAGFTTLRSI